jgi:hypothetical protein
MNVLTSILLICAAGLTLAWLVAAQRRLVAYAARRFVRLPRLQQMLAVFAICILTVCAQKSGSNAVFNAEVLEKGRRGEKIIELSNNRMIESEEASASGSVISHGGTETRSGEIIELSNNRIIESEEASASGSDDSRRTAENAEGETDAPQAEESLSNHNSIIRQFDYSIIDSNASASPSLQNLRVTQITNLCATAIRPAETSVFLRAHWPVDATNEASSLEVYACTNLLTNAWFFVGKVASAFLFSLWGSTRRRGGTRRALGERFATRKILNCLMSRSVLQTAKHLSSTTPRLRVKKGSNECF